MSAELDQAVGECAAGSGHDTISLSGDITLGSKLWDIRTAVTINGNRHSISGADSHRIFEVQNGNLTVNDLTMTNGRPSMNGGAISVDGGSLTINNSKISDSYSSNYGGGIYASNSDVTISESTLSGNESHNHGGGISYSVGNINPLKSLVITNSSFERNETIGEDIDGRIGGQGGAIYLDGGSVNISGSSFSQNSVSKSGGAIYDYAKSDTPAASQLSVSNSTFIGNVGPQGAAVYLHSGTTANLTHVTIAGNTAFAKKASLHNLGTLSLRNSIVADTVTGVDCIAETALSENSGNLIEDGTCSAVLSGNPLLGEATGQPQYLPLQVVKPGD